LAVKRSELGTASIKQVYTQSIFSLSFDFLGIFAGIILTTAIIIINKKPWLLLVYPPILSIRGNVNGIFSSKLGTLLHIGFIEPKIIGNSEEYYRLILAIIAISSLNFLGIGFFSFFICKFLLLITSVDLLDIILFLFLVGTIATLFSIFITSFVAFITYRKALDPDLIVYPIMSTVNDIIITIIFMEIGQIIGSPFYYNSKIFLTILLAGFLVVLIYTVSKNIRYTDYRKTMIESTPILLITILVGNITGSILAPIREYLNENLIILAILPAINDTLGDEGSMIASTTTTNLALGYLEPRISNIKLDIARNRIFGVFLAGLSITALYGIVASFFVRNITLKDVINSSITSTLANIIGFLLVVPLSFILAIATFRRGWDPDNLTLPLLTTFTDLIGVSSVALITYLL